MHEPYDPEDHAYLAAPDAVPSGWADAYHDGRAVGGEELLWADATHPLGSWGHVLRVIELVGAALADAHAHPDPVARTAEVAGIFDGVAVN